MPASLEPCHGIYRYGGLHSYGLYSYGLHIHGIYSYDLYRYGLYSYGLYSYGLYSYGLQRNLVAVLVAVKWLRLVNSISAFELFSSGVLPIIQSALSTGPFFLILLIVIGAFLHACTPMDLRSVSCHILVTE